MNPGGENVPVYNESRTADSDPARKWDSVLEPVDYGKWGGVFKDIWSASPYAAAGLFSPTPQRREPCMRFRWSTTCAARYDAECFRMGFYALQTEEEVAESSWCQPLELSGCDSLTFANLYLFRGDLGGQRLPAGGFGPGLPNTEFGICNFTQMKYTMDFTLRMPTAGKLFGPGS